MNELIPMTELTGNELDAVCGGILDFGNIVPQSNNLTQTALNVLSVGGDIHQTGVQTNVSLIGSAVVFPLHI